MNKIIAWEDISIKTDLITGLTQLDDDNDDLDEESESPEELITSPFGVFHVRDFFNPMKQYDWHICHTNFNISKDVLEKFRKHSGVEKIVVLSRYRLLVAFGKAFNSLIVKKGIYDLFGASPPLSKEVLAKKKDLESIYGDNWFIYYLDDDDWEALSEEDDEEYQEKLLEYRQKQKKYGGIIITNETDI